MYMCVFIENITLMINLLALTKKTEKQLDHKIINGSGRSQYTSHWTKGVGNRWKERYLS